MVRVLWDWGKGSRESEVVGCSVRIARANIGCTVDTQLGMGHGAWHGWGGGEGGGRRFVGAWYA